MSESDTKSISSPGGTGAAARGSTDPKDRHEPRGRKPNDHLPPSRAREVQRAFRLRRAEHLASLEERINNLESENSQLRALLSLPEADRGKIGSGPTGRGKSLRDGGVPMSERVRARKEARERERRAKGLPEPDSSEQSDRGESETLSPSGVGGTTNQSHNNHHHHDPNNNHGHTNPALPLFANPAGTPSAPFNYQLPFNLPVSPDASFGDFTHSLDSSSLFKSGSTPGYSNLFNMFDTPGDTTNTAHPPPTTNAATTERRSPLSPPLTNPGSSPAQPDLLTRLKACCHLSDSHVVNDPGLLIFATRLCQSFPCSFSGVHPDPVAMSDSEHLLLEDSWRALKLQLDPGGEADGENRINTGRMAAELVCRAAHSRGPGGWIVCRYREGMSIKRTMIAQLVQGLGGKFD